MCKARFEEAKKWELPWEQQATQNRMEQPVHQPLARHAGSQTSAIRCYNCGGLGHIAKQCTVAHRTTSKEAEGDTKSSGMATLTTTTPTFEEISPSLIDQEVARLHGLTSATRLKGPEFGPKYTLPALLEGKKTVALVPL